ncbi:MAG TPA: hypothetical protein VFT59_01005, partial [Candidatus Saccharimonadales bacterium]|nr:hypothetical protein [Candidatus Saccharimonadales bacterium]
ARTERMAQRQRELQSVLTGDGAFHRAALEAFCEDCILLPLDGLDAMSELLLEKGFYWEWHSSQMARVFFPDGWKLTPVELGQDESTLYTASLTDPAGMQVARIRYCSYPYLASMQAV